MYIIICTQCLPDIYINSSFLSQNAKIYVSFNAVTTFVLEHSLFQEPLLNQQDLDQVYLHPSLHHSNSSPMHKILVALVSD